jgi:hypothetical protein
MKPHYADFCKFFALPSGSSPKSICLFEKQIAIFFMIKEIKNGYGYVSMPLVAKISK